MQKTRTPGAEATRETMMGSRKSDTLEMHAAYAEQETLTYRIEATVDLEPAEWEEFTSHMVLADHPEIFEGNHGGADETDPSIRNLTRITCSSSTNDELFADASGHVYARYLFTKIQ